MTPKLYIATGANGQKQSILAYSAKDARKTLAGMGFKITKLKKW